MEESEHSDARCHVFCQAGTPPQKDAEQYFKALLRIYEESPGRYLYAHSTLQKSVASYFELLDWTYAFEVPLGDLDFSHRFDLMARKGAKVIVAEVKPEITTRDLGQTLGYVFAVKRHYKKARVFLATDILNLDVVLGGGEITDIIADNARNHGLGIMFADKEIAYLVPAEFLIA